MGGKSTTEQSSTNNQTSTTNPWSNSMPFLNGLLSQLNTQLTGTGATGSETDAINGYINASRNGNPYSGLVNNFAQELLSGGGEAGNISQNLADYKRRLGGIADGSMLGPNGNPMLQKYLDVNANDIQSRVNGMFAGSGRDLSGKNVQSLSRGISEGNAPILAAQYNTDVSNMMNAANSLYGAGNTTSGLLTGLKGMGVGLSNDIWDRDMQSKKNVLEAELTRRSIPLNSLGLLANLGISAAGLGSTTNSSGSSTGKGSSTMSGAQQFNQIGSGLGNLTKFLSFLTG